MANHRPLYFLAGQQRLMQWLEGAGRLNRKIEFLPTDEEIARRRAHQLGLTAPEGAVLVLGYHTSDSSIMGFSHTHLSGTGVGDMLDVLLMPGTGPAKTVPGTRDNPGSGYRSRFSHDGEKAEPGYYSVELKDYAIRAELSATERAGIHRYTFPASDSAHFIVDLAHAILSQKDAAPKIVSSELKIVDSSTVVGGPPRWGNWAPGRHIYFAMRFSQPFAKAELGQRRQDARRRPRKRPAARRSSACCTTRPRPAK